MTPGDILTDQKKKYFSLAQMSAISALKLSLWEDGSGGYYTIVYLRKGQYVPLVPVCSRRNIYFILYLGMNGI